MVNCSFSCSILQSACIFSIMVSMLVSPTLVLSTAGGAGRTWLRSTRPALPSCRRNSTSMGRAGSAYLIRLEPMLSRMRRIYCARTVRSTSSLPSSSAQAKPRCCSISTISASGSSKIWEKRAGASSCTTVSRVTSAYSNRLSDSCLICRALPSIFARYSSCWASVSYLWWRRISV